MITFNKMGTHGRLGNQMFQYCLIFSVAKKLKLNFGAPYKNKSNDEYKNFCLDEGFCITAGDSSNHIPKYKFIEKKWMCCYFDKSVFDVQDDTDFIGSFQSEKYFQEFEKEIRKEFQFKSTVIQKSNEIISEFKKPLAAISIRRGDYLLPKFKKTHFACDINYFFKCIKKIPEETFKLIITDDIEWAKKKFSKIKNYKILDQNLNDPKNKFIVLRIISMCDYHIISNSSFCWWGAWLCENKNKKVIAPKNWFGQLWPRNSWNDVYCKDWNIIDNEFRKFL